MTNKLLIFGFLTLASLAPAQLVTLSKAEKVHENQDKFLYKINPDNQIAQYLGEIEVDGFSKDDADVFSKIYKKAKTLGANTFSLKPEFDIDGQTKPFNPAHYRINLYYSTAIPTQENLAYVFASGGSPIKMRVDNKKFVLQPRSYIIKVINYGGENSVTAGSFLGSRINLTAKKDQPAQYFQISSFDVKSDQTGGGGINIKSGDIIGLEKSYAQFLSVIYKQQKY